MNKKAWWQKIKQNYPLTLLDCRGFFEMRFRETWRIKMQDYKELLPYFQEKYIDIDLRPSYRKMGFPKYGYKLYTNFLTIQREAIYETPEIAAFDAFEFAFRCREQYLEKRQHKSTFQPNRQRKIDKERKMKRADKVTWGEQNGEKI